MKRLFLCLIVLSLLPASGCRGQVVARVNGQIITKDKVVGEMLKAGMGNRALQDMIMQAIIGQEAKRRGVAVTKAEVDQAIKEQTDAVGEKALKMFADQDPNWEQKLRANLEPRLLVCKFVVGEKDVKEYFDNNRVQFDKPALVSYRRIVLKTKPEAEQVRELLVSGKATIEGLARERSVDPQTKDQGGLVEDQPIVSPAMFGAMGGDVAKVLESQPMNEYSPAMPYMYPPDSFQIVQVVKRVPARAVKYESVKSSALMRAAQSRGAELQKIVQDLQTKATIEVVDKRFRAVGEAFEKLKLERAPGGAGAVERRGPVVRPVQPPKESPPPGAGDKDK